MALQAVLPATSLEKKDALLCMRTCTTRPPAACLPCKVLLHLLMADLATSHLRDLCLTHHCPNISKFLGALPPNIFSESAPCPIYMCASVMPAACGHMLPAQRATGDVLADEVVVVIPERLPGEALGLRLIRPLVGRELPETREPGHHHAVALGQQLRIGLAGAVEREEALVPDQE